MRLFAAVPIPRETAAQADRLLPDVAALRRVAPELMHVTLAFLGSVPDSAVAAASDAVADAAAGQRAFPVVLSAIGRFPATGAPRIVWIGAEEGAADLIRLAERLRSALTRRQLPFDEKPFRPHVTLARVREGADRASERAIAASVARVKGPRLQFRADRVLLLESALSPKGPRYTPRATVPLGAGGGGAG